MAGTLSPQAQQKISALQQMEGKIQHVYGLVERYAAARNLQESEALSMQVRRAFGKLKLELMGAALDKLSQLAGSMETAARRGGSQAQKARILREGVGSLRFQIEQEQRKVAAEDQEAQRAAAAKDQQSG